MIKPKVAHPVRIRAIAAKRGKAWCPCDLQLVGQVGKCHVCGRRLRPKKKRMPDQREELENA